MAQKTDHTNDTKPQTQDGNALPSTQASCCNKTWSLHLPKGARSQAALSPMLTSQPFPAIPNLVPSSQPLPSPSTSLSEGQGSESTLANRDAPAVAWFRIVICNKK